MLIGLSIAILYFLARKILPSVGFNRVRKKRPQETPMAQGPPMTMKMDSHADLLSDQK